MHFLLQPLEATCISGSRLPFSIKTRNNSSSLSHVALILCSWGKLCAFKNLSDQIGPTQARFLLLTRSTSSITCAKPLCHIQLTFISSKKDSTDIGGGREWCHSITPENCGFLCICTFSLVISSHRHLECMSSKTKLIFHQIYFFLDQEQIHPTT